MRQKKIFLILALLCTRCRERGHKPVGMRSML